MPENLGEFFTWIGSAGCFALVMSLVLERLPNWENLNSDLKTLLSAIVAILLGLLSAALVKWVPAGVQADLEPWFERIMAALIIWAGSQYFHWKFDVAPTTKTISVTATSGTGSAAVSLDKTYTWSHFPPANGTAAATPPAAPPPTLLPPELADKAPG